MGPRCTGLRLAPAHVPRTSVIAITGSVGKTTAVECLKQVLSSCFAVYGTEYGNNSGREVALTVLRTRWRHRFTAIEVGTRKPGDLRKAAWMIAPDTAVVLAVAAVHTDCFASLEEIARDKSRLVSRLGRRGLAVLNGDDPRVAAMAACCRGRVVTFGVPRSAMSGRAKFPRSGRRGYRFGSIVVRSPTW